ncbi:MAG: NAD(P)-dependent oxidoreductase [Thermoanaerobaculia bacterium]
MKRAKVLITGGAGFLGVNLLRFLRAKGHALVSYDLAELGAPDLNGHVEAIRGDVRDTEHVARSLSGVGVVVHAAAALPLYTPQDIHTTDVVGTRTVLESARRQGVERVIHISSTAVYGIPDRAPFLEDDPLAGVGPYGRAKVEAEAVCREYRAKGITVPILRPATFVGPERLGVFDLLFDWALDGRNFPVLGSGEHRHQFLHVEDVCAAVESCMTRPPAAVNDTFNLGAKTFGTLRSDFQAVLDEAGFGKRIVSLPAGPAVAALRALEALGVSPLYRWVYESFGKDSYVSIDRAADRLGFRPAHGNVAALLSNFRWYRDHRAQFSSKTGISHRTPWKQGALRLVRRFF